MEISAHASYSEKFYPIHYWRTTSGFEVDYVLGDHEVAIEVKSTEFARAHHLKGLRRFKEEYNSNRYILVSLDPNPRRLEDEIEILPWNIFINQLWAGEIM